MRWHSFSSGTELCQDLTRMVKLPAATALKTPKQITQVLFASLAMARGKGFILALIVLTIMLSNLGTHGTFATFGEADGKLRGGNETVLWAGKRH